MQKIKTNKYVLYYEIGNFAFFNNDIAILFSIFI